MQGHNTDTRRTRRLNGRDLADELFQTPTVDMNDQRWLAALNTMQVQPTAGNLSLAPNESLLRRHHDIMRVKHKQGLPIRFLGYADTFSGMRVYEGPDNDWVLMNLDEDPQYLEMGEKLVAPRVVVEQLTKMQAHGTSADHIYIAHEVPKGSIKQGQAIPLEAILPPPPAEVAKRVSRYADQASGVWRSLTVGLVRVAGAALSLAALPLALDPVLFGVITDNSTSVRSEELGMWYYLAHWLWETEE